MIYASPMCMHPKCGTAPTAPHQPRPVLRAHPRPLPFELSPLTFSNRDWSVTPLDSPPEETRAACSLVLFCSFCNLMLCQVRAVPLVVSDIINFRSHAHPRVSKLHPCPPSNLTIHLSRVHISHSSRTVSSKHIFF